LQGVMGRYYALAQGEKPAVAEAIAAHYRPLGPQDEVPAEPVAIAVALADKADQLAGFFAVGEKPTGSGDPFALRRAALGIIRIVRENGLRLALHGVLEQAMAGYVDQWRGSPSLAAVPKQVAPLVRNHDIRQEMLDIATRLESEGLATNERILVRIMDLGQVPALREHGVAVYIVPQTGSSGELTRVFRATDAVELPTAAGLGHELMDFLTDRLRVQLRAEGTRHDVVTAVLGAAPDDDLNRLLRRAESVRVFVESDAGANLLAAHRRAANILRIEEKRDGHAFDTGYERHLLKAHEEEALAAALEAAAQRIEIDLSAEDFERAMEAMATLRAPVDAFFDKVIVNDPAPELRRNRLKLLARLRATMDAVADFSKIEALGGAPDDAVGLFIRCRPQRGTRGDAQPARRQRCQPRRDGLDRPAGPPGLHHHHRGLHLVLPERPALSGRPGSAGEGRARAHRAGRRHEVRRQPQAAARLRAGARASMPGMMDTVLNLGLNDATVEGLVTASGDARFAWDSYRRFIQMYGSVVLGVDHHRFEEIIEHVKLDTGKIEDTELTDRADTAARLSRQLRRLTDTVTIRLGGLELHAKADYSPNWEKNRWVWATAVDPELRLIVEPLKQEPQATAGLIARLEHLVESLPSHIDRLRVKRDELAHSLEQATRLVGKPFPHADALAAARHRFDKVTRAIADIELQPPAEPPGPEHLAAVDTVLHPTPKAIATRPTLPDPPDLGHGWEHVQASVVTGQMPHPLGSAKPLPITP